MRGPSSFSSTARLAWMAVALLWPVALLNYLDRQMLASMKFSVMQDVASVQTDANWGFMLGQFKWVYAFLSPLGGLVAGAYGFKPMLLVATLFYSLAAALRILTLPIWEQPETSETAAALITVWLDAAGAEVVPHPPAAWKVLAEFARTLEPAPRAIPDALLAASAIASRATVVTFDRGFSHYPGLVAEVLHPAA
jgi:predicted nucleic acid-binding protein